MNIKDDREVLVDNSSIPAPRKKINWESYYANDPRGKSEGTILLSQYDWKPITDCELYKAGDIVFEKNAKNGIIKATFEFEVRNESARFSWRNDSFPYSTIHIPIAKKGNPIDWYIAFNDDLNRAALMDINDIRRSNSTITDTYNDKTKEKTEGEEFVDVSCSYAKMFRKIEGKWIRSSKNGGTWISPIIHK
jgi:hypothetical protein